MQHQVTPSLCSSNTECMAVVCDLCMCNPACLFQEMILRDPSSGWDLGPDLDHFSSRTRHVLQYMNPNKINMDLLVELIAYLGTKHHLACVIQHGALKSWVKCLYFDALPDKSPQFAELDGAILVFLPGLAHIQQLYDLLSSDKRFKDKNRWQTQTDVIYCNPVWAQNHQVKCTNCSCLFLFGSLWFMTGSFRFKIVALHSTLSSKDQGAAFTVPPAGVRKVLYMMKPSVIDKQKNQSNVMGFSTVLF